MTVIKIVPMPGVAGPTGIQGVQGPQGIQGPSGGGGSADIADFTFIYDEGDNESTMLISNHDMIIRTGRDESQDADIDIDSADDVWIRANGDQVGISAAGVVEVSTNNGGNTWTFGDGGGLDLPNGGNIYNPANTSGDGAGLPTLRLTPATYLGTDQYIILDPTAPNHIHIRAGGDIDASNAQLILGGEKANVIVADSSHSVQITTYDSGTDTYHNWGFGNDGVIYPPLGGFNFYGGVSGSFVSQDGKTITVTNGLITNIEVNP